MRDKNEDRLKKMAKELKLKVERWNHVLYVRCPKCGSGWYGIHGALTCCKGLEKK